MIEVIYFDYFGVISSDGYWDLNKEDKQSGGAYSEISDDVNLGKMHWDEFVEKISLRSGQTIDAINKMYEENSINKQLMPLIQRLKFNYKIGLLTSAHHEYLEPLLKKFGLNDVFDYIVISSRVGFTKPDVKIYKFAENLADVKPSEILFVDDLVRNVSGAQEVGWQALLYSSAQKLLDDLKSLELI